jgi:hypothetical protein
MEKLNPAQQVAFYNARIRKGDTAKLAAQTGYSTSHVINVRAGRRTAPASLAEAMFKLSRRRSAKK